MAVRLDATGDYASYTGVPAGAVSICQWSTMDVDRNDWTGWGSIGQGNVGTGDTEIGFQTAIDLATLIDVLFAGADNVQDQACPTFRFDVDCDGFITALDLARAIDYLFANGAPPCNPCAPGS